MRKARSPEGLSLALLNYWISAFDAKTNLPSISLVHPSNETHEILANRKVSIAGQFNSKLPVKANISLPAVGGPVMYQANSDANNKIIEGLYCYAGIR